MFTEYYTQKHYEEEDWSSNFIFWVGASSFNTVIYFLMYIA